MALHGTGGTTDTPGGDDALRDAVRAALQQEELLAWVVESVRRRLGVVCRSEAAGSPLPPPPTGEGPLPIGPYEIRPDLSDIRWHAENPPGTEWLDRAPAGGSQQASGPADGPRRGPHIHRGSHRDPITDDD